LEELYAGGGAGNPGIDTDGAAHAIRERFEAG
jgi:hypothetical protein